MQARTCEVTPIIIVHKTSPQEPFVNKTLLDISLPPVAFHDQASSTSTSIKKEKKDPKAT